MMKGKIVRIMDDKKFGFIRGTDGQDYFFHYTALQNTEFGSELIDRICEYEESKTSKGLRAELIYVE